MVPQFSNTGTICPCLNPFPKQRLLIPDKAPRLAVVDKLLELHGGHRSTLRQDEGRYIVNAHRGAHSSPRRTVVPIVSHFETRRCDEDATEAGKGGDAYKGPRAHRLTADSADLNLHGFRVLPEGLSKRSP